jgi:HNH endonuclease
MKGKIALDEAGCWLWTKAVFTQTGYAETWDGIRPRTGHRYAYETIVGPVPEGLVLDHLCNVRRCVNPAHLEPVTQRENLRRAGLFDFKPFREECSVHGPDFIRIQVAKDRPRGYRAVCRECLNVNQRNRRARLKAA